MWTRRVRARAWWNLRVPGTRPPPPHAALPGGAPTPPPGHARRVCDPPAAAAPGAIRAWRVQPRPTPCSLNPAPLLRR